jgi:hypothetical protein
VTKPRYVRCPQCGAEALYAPENAWRPFCSERCKQIDLGAWASDQYSIAGQPTDEDLLAPVSDFHERQH